MGRKAYSDIKMSSNISHSECYNLKIYCLFALNITEESQVTHSKWQNSPPWTSQYRLLLILAFYRNAINALYIEVHLSHKLFPYVYYALIDIVTIGFFHIKLKPPFSSLSIQKNLDFFRTRAIIIYIPALCQQFSI